MRDAELLIRSADSIETPPDERRSAEPVQEPAAQQQRGGVLGLLTGFHKKMCNAVHAYRQWQAPEGIDVDAVDRLVADLRSAIGQRARGVYTMGLQQMHVDELMQMFEERMPHLADDLLARDYVLTQGGYRPGAS